MIEQVHTVGTQVQGNHITILACRLEEKLERILPCLREDAEQRIAVWAGGGFVGARAGKSGHRVLVLQSK
jgi:hypothetical protein